MKLSIVWVSLVTILLVIEHSEVMGISLIVDIRPLDADTLLNGLNGAAQTVDNRMSLSDGKPNIIASKRQIDVGGYPNGWARRLKTLYMCRRGELPEHMCQPSY